MKHRDLTPDPAKAYVKLAMRLEEAARQQTTVPHGVKDMGETGDTVFTTPEGERKSVRHFAVELSDTSQMAERLEQDLAENATAIEDARLELLTAMESIDATNVITQGPPPLDPVIGKTIWISPEGYTYRAVECEEN